MSLKGNSLPSNAKPKTVFILRDFDQKEIEETLELARELPGLDVHIPGLGTQDDQELVYQNEKSSGGLL